MRERLAGLAGSSAGSLVVLAVLGVALWLTHVYGVRPDYPAQGFAGTDLSVESYLLYAYAWGELAGGSLPLWNPFQLCGTPLLAIPYAGLAYPGNLFYFLPDVALGIELGGIAHLIFAGCTFHWLVRTLGMPQLAGLTGAASYMACAGVTLLSETPVILSGICWLPATLLAIEATLKGDRRAPLGFLVCVVFQLLNGASEILVYNLLAGAGWTVMRCFQRAQRSELRTAIERGLLLLVLSLAAAGISAFQLLPTLELVGQSQRADGVSIQQALFGGVYPTQRFVSDWLTGEGPANPGALGVVAWWLAIQARGQRGVLLLCAVIAVVTLLLASGGPLYQLYHDTALGQLFRRPQKLLYLHQFAQALVVAIAMGSLVAHAAVPRRGSGLAFRLALAWGVGVLVFALSRGAIPGYLIGVLLLLAASSVRIGDRWRRAGLVLIALVHVASVASHSRAATHRPFQDTAAFDEYAPLFEQARRSSGGGRIYGDRRLFLERGVAAKQGGRQRLLFVDDYHPLRPARHQEFLDAMRNGETWVGSNSRLELLDMASTSIYLTRVGSTLDQRMQRDASSESDLAFVSLLGRQRHVRLWRRDSALPRAYYVTSAHFSPPAQALSVMLSESFDARAEVVLEASERVRASSGEAPRSGAAGTRRDREARVQIRRDEDTSVVIDVWAPQKGYLVLTDSHYPGWQARVDGLAVPIHRANHLFRAVEVPQGASLVAFEYRPASLRHGLLLSLGTGLLTIAGLGILRRRARAAVEPTGPVIAS